jgi:hypothetical protein
VVYRLATPTKTSPSRGEKKAEEEK